MSPLTEDQEKLKREIYEKISPRRRKFIDKIGYDEWDPFAMPKDPIDIRQDDNQYTTSQLIQMFMKTVSKEDYNDVFAKGAFEMCLGIMDRDERALGGFAFAKWYAAFSEENRRLNQKEDAS
jgi:hypothetical protein